MSAPSTDASDDAGWRAELALDFAAEPGGPTRLVSRRHRGPLVVQRPFYPEGPLVPHVYVLHPPGGIVGGDSLDLDVRVGAGAHALLTTPAATKVYRTRGPLARQSQRLIVSAGGAMEWLPQEMILHDGTAVALDTTVELAPGARFVGMETLCFGLPARGEHFSAGRCRQRFELWRSDGTPLLLERGRFDAGDPVHAAAWGLGGARVTGLMVATPFPTDGALLSRLQALATAASETNERAAVTIVGAGDAAVSCLRFVGASTERARRFFQQAWIALRPAVIGSPAIAPRIWAT